MFLLVNNFKMIGMLLNVVHGQVQKIELTKTYNKGFPNHSTLINYDQTQKLADVNVSIVLKYVAL